MCLCNPGFVGDGTYCYPSSHCLSNTDCHEKASCRIGGLGKVGLKLIRIASHVSIVFMCTIEWVCLITCLIGWFQNECVCMIGYHGNGTSCILIDMCTVNNGGCHKTVSLTINDRNNTHAFDLYWVMILHEPILLFNVLLLCMCCRLVVFQPVQGRSNAHVQCLWVATVTHVTAHFSMSLNNIRNLNYSLDCFRYAWHSIRCAIVTLNEYLRNFYTLLVF